MLVLASVAGLLLIPFGLPGLWVIVLGIIGYGWLTDFASVSGVLIAAAIGLASLGEIVEAWIGFGFAKRYGGSNRAGWGALVGGLTGAVVGVPVPVIGSVSAASSARSWAPRCSSTPGRAARTSRQGQGGARCSAARPRPP